MERGAEVRRRRPELPLHLIGRDEVRQRSAASPGTPTRVDEAADAGGIPKGSGELEDLPPPAFGRGSFAG